MNDTRTHRRICKYLDAGRRAGYPLRLIDLINYLRGDVNAVRDTRAHVFALAHGLIAVSQQRYVITRTGRIAAGLAR